MAMDVIKTNDEESNNDNRFAVSRIWTAQRWMFVVLRCAFDGLRRDGVESWEIVYYYSHDDLLAVWQLIIRIERGEEKTKFENCQS